MNPFDAIYTVWSETSDGKHVQVHLSEIVHADTENVDDPINAKIKLHYIDSRVREFSGPVVQAVLERMSFVSNPKAMKIFYKGVIQDILKDPEKKPGRPKAYRDSNGKLQNLKLKACRTIDHWDDGMEIPAIAATINPQAQSPKQKKFTEGQIRRTLRRWKHLLDRPYNTK